MRTRLSDLISTLDEYNDIEEKEFSAAVADIETFSPHIPKHAIVSENHKKLINSLLITEGQKEQTQKKRSPLDNKNTYVMSYETFLKEGFQKRPPQDPDYDDRPRDWNDEDLDEEE